MPSIKKCLLLTPEVNEALRRAAYEQHRPEAAVVRDALIAFLGLPTPKTKSRRKKVDDNASVWP